MNNFRSKPEGAEIQAGWDEFGNPQFGITAVEDDAAYVIVEWTHRINELRKAHPLVNPTPLIKMNADPWIPRTENRNRTV